MMCAMNGKTGIAAMRTATEAAAEGTVVIQILIVLLMKNVSEDIANLMNALLTAIVLAAKDVQTINASHAVTGLMDALVNFL